MTPIEAAWLAGFIDADGCIGCYVFGVPYRLDRRVRYRHHKIRLQATNSHEATIRHIKEITGTGIATSDVHGPANWKRRHVWEVTGRNALPILAQIEPYMIRKKRQAQIALQWTTTEMRSSKGLTDAEYEKRERIRAQLRKLNQRGRPA